MKQTDLFEENEYIKQAEPLAEKMRPTTLEEFCGQEHLMGKGQLLYRLVTTGSIGSSIFYGPPGTGKTTLAKLIAKTTNGNFVQLNAVNSGVSEARDVIEKAKYNLQTYGKKTYLLLDECHRWSKAQSDQVLGAIEQGYIIFIGSTTENPFHSMTKAIVSRCRVFGFKPLSKNAIIKSLNNAITSSKGLGEYKVKVDEDALNQFALMSGGDLRFALNSLELAFKSTDSDENGLVHITKEIANISCGGKLLSVDEDSYYDMLSAFCKSLRGSDADASLYWAFRLIESGLDPLIIYRRLIAHASEDVGLANSNALVVAVSAMQAYKDMGEPEGLIPLAHAIINVALSPKSNSVIIAKDLAIDAVKNTYNDAVPDHLKNYNYLKEKRQSYKYPHDYGGYVKQQYLPDSIKDKVFYTPSNNGNEKKTAEFIAQKNEYIKSYKNASKNTFNHGKKQ